MTREELINIGLQTKILKKIENECLRTNTNFPHWVQKETLTPEQFLFLENLRKNYNFVLSLQEQLYCLKKNINSRPTCKQCGKETQYHNPVKGFSEFCCLSCSAQNKDTLKKRTETYLQEYGVSNSNHIPESQEKRKKTCQEKYRADNYFASSLGKEVTEKRMLELYGVTHNSKSPVTIEKRKKVFLEKYGVDNPNKSPEIQTKTKKTNLEKYGVVCYLNTDEVKQQRQNNRVQKMYNKLLSSSVFSSQVKPLFTRGDYKDVKTKMLWKCIKCGDSFEDTLINGQIPRCPVCHPAQNGSHFEDEVIDWLYSLGIKEQDIQTNARKIIPPKELDIYFPEYKVAIECNGNYFHRENGPGNYPKSRHADKQSLCEKEGIKLLQIRDDEWRGVKQDIVKEIILRGIHKGNKQQIGARKCTIQLVPKVNAELFLNKHHLQGYIPAKQHQGLFYKQELVALLSMGKPRFTKKYDWEVLRYAVSSKYYIAGAFAKLWNSVSAQYPGKIVSYADRRLFSGNIYKQAGFNLVRTTSFGYGYVEVNSCHTFYPRQIFQKSKLQNLLDAFDPNLTEGENMQLNGYDRIWDCGQFIWEKIS